MAAVDYFLKIDGIKGESQDKAHKDEIQLESFSWGASNSGSAGQGSGMGSGKVVAQDFHFVKKVDKASPVLFISCTTGKHIKNAILSARKAGDGQKDYYQITLEDILISSYSVGGAGNSDVVPIEQVSINFGKMEVVYKEQKSADGSTGGDVKQKYDFVQNVKV